MASKRIAASAVNWGSIAERVHPAQRISFNNFKTRSDKYLRAVQANPEQSPAINWEDYRKRIKNPAVVDQFKAAYEGLKIAYPQADQLTASVDAQAKAVAAEIEQFKSGSKQRVAEYHSAIEHLKSLLPFDQMTLEDYRDAYPELALDPINRPSFWPHTPEEQLDHKAEGQAPPAAH